MRFIPLTLLSIGIIIIYMTYLKEKTDITIKEIKEQVDDSDIPKEYNHNDLLNTNIITENYVNNVEDISNDEFCTTFCDNRECSPTCYDYKCSNCNLNEDRPVNNEINYVYRSL